jgi:hypothetical protein
MVCGGGYRGSENEIQHKSGTVRVFQGLSNYLVRAGGGLESMEEDHYPHHSPTQE